MVMNSGINKVNFFCDIRSKKLELTATTGKTNEKTI